MSVHFSPGEGRAGDVIPFFDGQRWHVFYLNTPENRDEGTAWHHLVSDDLVAWRDLGEAIGRGAPESQDASVATGSIIERSGVYYAFYTGFSIRRKAAGLPEQGVLRASSTDLNSWTKDADFATLTADPSQYDEHDWRDPFVFWNEEAREYWMLLAGQRRTGALRRRGVIARYTSDDLDSWRLVEPFWEPGETVMHECPDVFRWGAWWYLLYSTLDDRQVTRYRMSRSLAGPWIAPGDDALDDDGLYAAKTFSNGSHRYLVGWVPTRDPARDDGTWQWGGSLVTHELHQRVDGTLAVGIPPAVLEAAGAHRVSTIEPGRGEWSSVDGQWRVQAGDGFAWAGLGTVPEQGSWRLRTRPGPGVFEFGIGFRTEGALDAGYLIRVRPQLGRLEFDRFPREAFDPILHERPIRPVVVDRELEIELVWDGQTIVVALDDVVLTARCYGVGSGLALFVDQGDAVFEQLA